MAEYHIKNGGIAASSSYGNGDVVYVSSGGRVWSSTVDYGTMYISSGGSASRTNVGVAKVYINSGGYMNSTTVNAAGNLLVLSGGSADNVDLDGICSIKR